jgi:hypothetical protein
MFAALSKYTEQHQENQKKTYLPLLTYCLSALDQVY